MAVNDLMQRGYNYQLLEPVGCNFEPGFDPQLTPAQMLKMGWYIERNLIMRCKTTNEYCQ